MRVCVGPGSSYWRPCWCSPASTPSVPKTPRPEPAPRRARRDGRHRRRNVPWAGCYDRGPWYTRRPVLPPRLPEPSSVRRIGQVTLSDGRDPPTRTRSWCRTCPRGWARLCRTRTATLTQPPGDPRRLTLFRDTTVPVTTGHDFSKPEPSTDQSGRNIFATGNFHAEFSRDNGRIWRGLDPYTIFGPDFCCDQVTKAGHSYRRQHWVLQYIPAFEGHPGGGHLVLANSRIGGFVNWLPYTITPSTFGWSNDLNLDYNDIVIGRRYLYLTTRIIRFRDGIEHYDVLATAILRVSRADLAAGRPAHYDAIARTDTLRGGEDGELRVPQGITDVASAASPTLPVGKGRRLRLLVWPENSKWVTTVDRTVPPFRYLNYPQCSGLQAGGEADLNSGGAQRRPSLHHCSEVGWLRRAGWSVRHASSWSAFHRRVRPTFAGLGNPGVLRWWL